MEEPNNKESYMVDLNFESLNFMEAVELVVTTISQLVTWEL